MFTRQHYKAIAEIIALSNDKRQILERLILYLKNDNPRFDAYKFREYINKLEYQNRKTVTSVSISTEQLEHDIHTVE